MSEFRHATALDRVFSDLEKDLLRDGGPQISTTRNYNFAIAVYDPSQEFPLRRHVSELSEKLRNAGWITPTIALHTLLIARLRQMGDDVIASIIAREKRTHPKDPDRALRHLSDKVVRVLEGPGGIAADVIREIEKLTDKHPDSVDRMVVFIGRAGSLYPFFRTSSLLKHVADRPDNVPVILLYPGVAVGETGLSFMGKLPADRDYRPRIYS